MNDLAIVGGRIFDGFNSYDANIYIKSGKISAVSSEKLDAVEVYNANGMYLLPGLIDPHVHFALNLGKYTSADDFESGSIGAAYGGITTFIDFLDPVTKRREVEENFSKRMKAASRSHVDYSFHMTIAHPDFSPRELIESTLALGINSVKSFTTYSVSNRMTEDGYIFELLRESKKAGVVATFHAEDDPMILYNMSKVDKHLPRDLPLFHSYEVEAEAVSRISTLAKLTNGQAYIVHDSSGRSVDLLFKNGIPHNLRLETCPQYVSLDDSIYNEGPEEAALHSLVPPLRSKEDVELMRCHLEKGTFHTIGTDHCPFKREEKLKNMNDYDGMPNGIGGVETSFSILYTLFVSTGKIKMNDLVKMQSVNVSKTFGLVGKGQIVIGTDADIAIFDPHKKWHVTSTALHTNSDYTPYEGMKLKGKFVSTIVRGNFVVKDGNFLDDSKGEFVKRGPVFWHTL